ncbi:DNA polymerase III subunit psi [Motilimonas eburnea]|uniref:DNA polymerase III subunit psi n=1 Tax=Motilimonas eburnea TaxID=1737488 RepID=UPI001E3E949C|nr:DNA polymerase III subunit psi [Motilimonas eburnea]MCE2571328.1 DNA polymerase III subunit psi [Motilimonas eburnea]
MDQYHAYLLHEMGITPWQLNASSMAEPSAKGATTLPTTLPKPDGGAPMAEPVATSPLDLSCYEIVILAEPTALNSDFVVAVLKSMGLEPSQAKVLSMDEFAAYRGAMAKWLWSTQGEIPALPDSKVIFSPSIAQTSRDQAAKRTLWGQIKSYLSGEGNR